MTTSTATTVVIDAAGRGTYRWRCERCHRQGLRQTREKAEVGAERHRAMHRAQDAVGDSSEEP